MWSRFCLWGWFLGWRARYLSQGCQAPLRPTWSRLRKVKVISIKVKVMSIKVNVVSRKVKNLSQTLARTFPILFYEIVLKPPLLSWLWSVFGANKSNGWSRPFVLVNKILRFVSPLRVKQFGQDQQKQCFTFESGTTWWHWAQSLSSTHNRLPPQSRSLATSTLGLCLLLLACL